MSQPHIIIVDYGAGNLRSVFRKFERVGAKVSISDQPDVIRCADKLVLPGVGHFANGAANLRKSGIWEVLNEKVLIEKTPILGICLGMQLMTKGSEEGDADGFGWFDAKVVRFQVSDRRTFKVPHMGWNNAVVQKSSALFAEVPPEAMFYFVHSYLVECRHKSEALALTTYDYPFVSAIARDNIYGTQFHPEKSHGWGEQLIRNFTEKA